MEEGGGGSGGDGGGGGGGDGVSDVVDLSASDVPVGIAENATSVMLRAALTDGTAKEALLTNVRSQTRYEKKKKNFFFPICLLLLLLLLLYY